MPVVLLLLIVPVVIIAMTPLMLVQRCRAGSARRPARPWVATLSIAAMAFSAVFFLASAAFTTIWIPQAFGGASIGMAIGLVLGAIGFVLTRWEPSVRSLHYTPNRWLVLMVTAIVSARIVYGLFRSFMAARAGLSGAAVAKCVRRAGVARGRCDRDWLPPRLQHRAQVANRPLAASRPASAVITELPSRSDASGVTWRLSYRENIT